MTDKTENVNGNYGLLSRGLQDAYKTGDWERASETLRFMAYILETENKHKDELKALILSFYFDLSGLTRQPFTNNDTIDRMRRAYQLSGMTEGEVTILYFDVIREDTLPKHYLTLTGSFRMFTYCLFGKSRKFDEVMSHLVK